MSQDRMEKLINSVPPFRRQLQELSEDIKKRSEICESIDLLNRARIITVLPKTEGALRSIVELARGAFARASRGLERAQKGIDKATEAAAEHQCFSDMKRDASRASVLFDEGLLEAEQFFDEVTGYAGRCRTCLDQFEAMSPKLK